MSRPLRIEYPGAWYHILNRGRRKEVIFTEPGDYKLFIKGLKEASETWQLRVAAYCLLPNHYHLLVQTPAGNISRAMRHVDGVYTQRFNRIHGHDGSLFRGRFKSILVDADSYLLQLIRYIHHNPLKAGLAKRLNSYEWSSHRVYVSTRENRSWLYTEKILSMLHAHEPERRRAYLQLMSRDEDDILADVYKMERWPSLLGSEEFIKKTKERFFPVTLNEDIPQMKDLVPEVERIKKAVCEAYGVTENTLSKSQRGIFNESRNVAVYLTRLLRGDSLNRIGEEFEIRKYSSVSSIIERMKVELGRNKELKNRVDKVRSAISKSQEQT